MSAMPANPSQARITRATPRERAELERVGFTPVQIDRLVALRAAYPLMEEIFTQEELKRLLFLQWLHSKWSNAAEDGLLVA